MNEPGQAPRRPGQERQAREEIGTPLFDELAFGREHIFMNETPDSGNELPTGCRICGVDEGDHKGVQHRFTPQGSPVDVSQFARKRSSGMGQGDDARRRIQSPQVSYQGAPFDPVLRQALVDKGIITVEDLEAAQRKINAITQMIAQQQPKYRGGVEG